MPLPVFFFYLPSWRERALYSWGGDYPEHPYRIDIRLIILITGIVVTIYTVLGGMEAVIWTEVVQSVIKTAGAILVLVLIIAGCRAALPPFFHVAAAEHKFSLGSFKPDFTGDTFWWFLLYGLCMNITNFGVDQNYVQRYHTLPTVKEAAKSLWLCVCICMCLFRSCFFIIAAVYLPNYHQHTELLPAGEGAGGGHPSLGRAATAEAIQAKAAVLTDADIGDKVLPHLLLTKVPAGIAGI